MLAIKCFGGREPITTGQLAERLCIRHHSAVGLIDRLAAMGLVPREIDGSDHRRVRLRLTPEAERNLAELSASHLEELRRLKPALLQVLARTEEAAPAS